MKSRHLLKGIGLMLFMLFTTGIILPWVISNVIMPVWMIMFTLGGILCIWIVVLDKPCRLFIRIVLRSFRHKEVKYVD